MTPGRVLVILSLVVILGVPFALSWGRGADALPAGTPTLVVLTPHVQQIRNEFARAFSAWHQREHGSPVKVVYLTPGGTTDIRRQLEAQFQAALRRGDFQLDNAEVVLEPGTIDADLLFGGGSFDHDLLRRGVTVRTTAKSPEPTDTTTITIDLEVRCPMSVPAGFDQDELDALFGDNAIGTQHLYDPEQYWIGTALSSFGIVYNRDIYARLGLPEPTSFADLARPQLRGWVALADPNQSGSITTTFDSILGYYGWDDGWRLLREMCGNTRYFTSSSTKPPIDVSQGEAAAGLAIDFYGRGQAQIVGQGRVGYTDPAGSVYIDADPISILRGGPNPDLARRFLRFTLTEEGQALWQFHATDSPDGADNPPGPSGRPMGPLHSELRRMPIRRVMYERHWEHLMDKVNPFDLASDIANPGWRTGVQVMMGCFAIDTDHACRAAWDALCDARLDPAFPPDALAAMEARFFAWPPTPVDADGGFTTGDPAAWLEWTRDTYNAVRASWRPTGALPRAEIYYAAWFTRAYHDVEEMFRQRRVIDAPVAAAGAAP